MPYSIDRFAKNQLDLGRFPALVPDNTINEAVSSIKLIGKGTPNYGEHILENLVWMLENFASDSQPANPLTGQLWYETENTPGVGRLRVWNGLDWKTITTVGFADKFPKNPIQGDIFYNTTEKRLYYYEGPTWKVLGSANFSSVPPKNAINGEFWWNSLEKKLYVWHESAGGWQLVGPGPVISENEPVFPETGALWYQSTTQSLNYFNNTDWIKLATVKVNNTLPITGNEGDLFWVSTTNEFYVYSKTNGWLLIGPDPHVKLTTCSQNNISPKLGYFLFNTDNNLIYFWNGSAWVLPVSVNTDDNIPNSLPVGGFWYNKNKNKLLLKTKDSNIEFGVPFASENQPTNPNIGDIWYNTLDNAAYWFDGSSWAFLSDDSSGKSYTRNVKISNGVSEFNIRVTYVNNIISNVISSENITNIITSPFNTLFPNGLVKGINLPIDFKINNSAIEEYINLKINESIENSNNYPISIVPYPEILTLSKKFTVTGVIGSSGGKVSVLPGVKFLLANGNANDSIVSYKEYESTSFTSQELKTNSTYYLRVQILNNSPLFYIQEGLDSDGTPSSLKGTPNETFGGGFDSTKFDMLIAKIKTGILNSLPIVTTLSNGNELKAEANFEINVVSGNTWVQSVSSNLTLNWARTPKISEVILQGFSSATNQSIELNSTEEIRKAGIRKFISSRYEIYPEYIFQDSGSNNGRILFKIIALI